MRLSCDACAAPIAEEAVDRARALARCSYCGAVLDLSRRRSASGEAFPSVERADVPLPPGFVVSREGTGLAIVRRWWSAKYAILGVFAVVWNGFLLFFFRQVPRDFLLFGLLHIGVGVFLVYFVLAALLNRTTLTVARGAVEVRHRPLPWPGNLRLETGGLEQLYCTEKVSRSRNGESRSYQVAGVRRGGGKVVILKGLESLDQALFVEQRIERHLGIEDRPVGGEVPR